MKKYSLSALFKMCLVLVSCLAFITACEKADNLSTDQLGSSEVLLRSFGPCPIARGAELRIMGANMDKVESVVLPGNETITDIKRISSTEIRITIPQDAQPGIITLKARDKEISSITALTFSEPISITSVTPLTAKAGDVITIKGDYLNLIEEIIFTDDVHVLKADFKSQSRQEIEVVVPVKAQTGKVIVSNGADIIPNSTGAVGIPIWVYSDDELIVTLPAITKISPNPIKAGNVLIIDGTNFDLVDSIAFGGNVGTRSFVSKTATQIKVTVPVNTQDGKVKAIAFSGVFVESADSLKLLMPTITSIDPNPVKNGTMLTIKGTDLDLINKVVFGGEKEGTIVEGGTATQIQVKVPIDATDGAVTFSTLAGKTVQSAVLALVKPTITSIAPTTIIAGESLTITGTDLDLVSSVNLGGNTTGVISSQSATQIVVQTLTASTSGTVVLITTNGTQVTSSQTITINTANIPVITSLPASVKPGAMLSIVGNKLNLVESVVFQDGIKAMQYGSRTASLLEVYVPQDAKRGAVTLTLNTYDGQQVVSPSFVVTGTDPITDPSLVLSDFDGKGANDIWGAGSIQSIDGPSGNYYEVLASNPANGSWQFGFANNWYNAYPVIKGVSNYVLKMDIRLRNDIAPTTTGWCTLQMIMGAAGTFDIDSYFREGNMYSTGGEWKTITIPLPANFPDPSPASAVGNWGLIFNEGGGANVSFVGLCIDNIRYEKIN